MPSPRSHPILRRGLQMAAALFAGLFFTVALAWAAAALFPPGEIDTGSEAERTVERDGWWYRQTTFTHIPTKSPMAWAAWMSAAHCSRVECVEPNRRDRGKPQIISRSNNTDLASVLPGSSSRWLMPWLEPGKPDPTILSRERHLYAYGWPLAALGQVRDFTQVSDNNFQVTQEGTIGVPARLTFGRPPPPMWSSWTLPAHILGRGLLLDTLLFAAAFWSFFAAVGHARRARRRRRNLCPHCAYDLRATPPNSPCPECGHPHPNPRSPDTHQRVHRTMSTVRTRTRSGTRTRRLLASLLAALLLQVPLAWAIVYLNPPQWRGETSIILMAPSGSTSNVAKVRIENDTHFGVRWVEVTAWSSAYAQPVYRSDEESLFDDNPTWPFPIQEILPGARDPAAWPASVPTSPSFVTGNFGHTLTTAYAIGWPYLCVTGRSSLNLTTGAWNHTGVKLLKEPSFRRWTLLGCVPLCYTPRWPGLAGNTLALGTPLFITWSAAANLRPLIRRRRGQCTRCGYDLRATPAGSPCPECGRPIG